MYYLVGIFRTLSLGRQHLKQTQDNYSKDVKGELEYIGVLPQRTGSPEHQISWLKKTRYPKWRNWALFYLREDAGVWAHWNLPFDMHLSSLGPHYPLHITSFFSSGRTAGTAVRWLMKVKVAQLCRTLCDPVDYTVRGILQAWTLEWVVYPFSRGSSQSRNQTRVSCTAGGFYTSWAMREAMMAARWQVIFSSRDPSGLTSSL